MWGHSLMKTQMLSIRKVARLALVYFTSMWKFTPTAGLEIILNQKPPHQSTTTRKSMGRQDMGQDINLTVEDEATARR